MATNSKLHNIWKALKSRCNNPHNKGYSHYGGRGIRVCSEWDSFRGFKADMEASYKDGLSIDRVDNNGNYSKENCRWTTRKVQNNNTRRNKYITLNGITKTLAMWTEEFGLKGSTVRQRFYVYKWSIERSLERSVI